MFVSSVYIAMLITNWGSVDLNSKEPSWKAYVPSMTSYWIKSIIAYASALLYIWTLIAPAIFKDRDFS